MPGFESFVILADMRTGSNALEEKLSDYKGLKSYGELFNPHFIGGPDTSEMFGTTLKARDEDPWDFLTKMRKHTGGIPGFRLFSDHDPRVRDSCLSDRRCAKVVLTRNPIESYVSLKIARQTGQWWLGDLSTAKSSRVRFDEDEFQGYLARRKEWVRTISRSLQRSGQSAFWLTYEDIGAPEIIDGLARYIGAREKADDQVRKGRVQNPAPLSDKVENYADLKQSLSAIDPFDVEGPPDFEPDRGPNVPSYVVLKSAPCIYTPVKGAGDQQVLAWLARIDGVLPDGLDTGFTRKSLRQWKRKSGRHVSFTVISHPLSRAHRSFCRYILPTEGEAFLGIRAVLKRTYGVALPDDPKDPAYDAKAHHKAFLGFLRFLKGNLAGQTAVRVDSAWASQMACVQGISQFSPLDYILRFEDLASGLELVAGTLGISAPETPSAEDAEEPFPLDLIYDEKLERAARSAYQKDYMNFGYSAWKAKD